MSNKKPTDSKMEPDNYNFRIPVKKCCKYCGFIRRTYSSHCTRFGISISDYNTVCDEWVISNKNPHYILEDDK